MLCCAGRAVGAVCVLPPHIPTTPRPLHAWSLDLPPSVGSLSPRWKLQQPGSKASESSVQFVKGDLTCFQKPPGSPEQGMDMVACLLGTFSHALDNGAAGSAFASAAAALRPGGLLVLELAHPGDLFDGTFIIG